MAERKLMAGSTTTGITAGRPLTALDTWIVKPPAPIQPDLTPTADSFLDDVDSDGGGDLDPEDELAMLATLAAGGDATSH